MSNLKKRCRFAWTKLEVFRPRHFQIIEITLDGTLVIWITIDWPLEAKWQGKHSANHIIFGLFLMEHELNELLNIFSTPRPNGSLAAQQTSRFIQSWLQSRSIPFRIETYTQYPYFFEANGVWMILTRVLLALSAWLRWGWWTPALALAGLLGGSLDSALHIPLVTWPGKRLGENILIEIPVKPPKADIYDQGKAPGLTPSYSELLLSAHYDSKTELLDHRQRMFFLRNILTGLILTLLVGTAGTLQAAWTPDPPPGWMAYIYWSGALLSLPLAILASGYGLNLSLGRLVKPSPGAVDNGAACVILLTLAERLTKQEIRAERIKQITIALFSGEEIDRQGSRAYVNGRKWLGSESILNLEAMAQNGQYVIWQRDGSVYRLIPTDARLNAAIYRAVEQVTGEIPVAGGPVLTDAAPFLEKGLPAAVLGTYDRDWKDAGFHRPSDNLDRLVVDRIDEGIQIALRFIEEVAG
jgi:hypothetical protein